MRKLLSLLLVLFITLSILKPQAAQAEIPVKAKAFLTMSAYGAAGGALLGLASMAFGTTTRAVTQGASLGLYAGIIFGSYVLISHHQRQAGSYEDTSSPYRQSTDIYGEDYQSDQGGATSTDEAAKGGFFDRFKAMQDPYYTQSFTFDSAKKKGGQIPPIYFNLIDYSF
jgi:hypothetical protein